MNLQVLQERLCAMDLHGLEFISFPCYTYALINFYMFVKKNEVESNMPWILAFVVKAEREFSREVYNIWRIIIP